MKKLAIFMAIAAFGLAFSGASAQADGLKSDFAQFTKYGAVECTCTKACGVHVTATNFGTDDAMISVEFGENDRLDVIVPIDRSFNFTQVIMGTKKNPGFVRIDPSGDYSNGSGVDLVGRVSVHGVKGGAKVRRTVTAEEMVE